MIPPLLRNLISLTRLLEMSSKMKDAIATFIDVVSSQCWSSEPKCWSPHTQRYPVQDLLKYLIKPRLFRSICQQSLFCVGAASPEEDFILLRNALHNNALLSDSYVIGCFLSFLVLTKTIIAPMEDNPVFKDPVYKRLELLYKAPFPKWVLTFNLRLLPWQSTIPVCLV